MPVAGIDERHAEEKERRRGRGKDQVLDAGFECLTTAREIRNHAVQGNAQNLEAEKKRCKMDARHQDPATQGRQNQQQIKFLALAVVFREILVGQHCHGRG